MPPIPIATYRLQFRAEFGFTPSTDTDILPDLSALGICHVYAPSIRKARQGGLHGYDGAVATALNAGSDRRLQSGQRIPVGAALARFPVCLRLGETTP